MFRQLRDQRRKERGLAPNSSGGNGSSSNALGVMDSVVDGNTGGRVGWKPKAISEKSAVGGGWGKPKVNSNEKSKDDKVKSKNDK